MLRCLEIDPSAATEYRKLIILYWEHIDGANVYVQENHIERLTSPESISRALRSLISLEIVKLGIDSKQIRAEKEEDYRGHYGRERPHTG